MDDGIVAANADVFVGSEMVEEVEEEAVGGKEVASGDIEKGNFTSESTSVVGGARKELRLVTD